MTARNKEKCAYAPIKLRLDSADEADYTDPLKKQA